MSLDPRSLSDMEIMRSTRGGIVSIYHPQYGEFKARLSSRNVAGLEKVRGEYSAWYAEQEYQASGEARAVKASLREADNGPKTVASAPAPAVQTAQGSLEDILQSQVDVLRARREIIESERERLSEETLAAQKAWHLVNADFLKADKFLKELKGDRTVKNTPEVSQAVGGNLHPQVGQRESGGSGGVGEESGAQGRWSGSESGYEDNQS